MLFKLIAGVAQVRDDDVVLTEEQKAAGAKQPNKVLKVGDKYETDVDMVAKHGADKWQLVDSNRRSRTSIPAQTLQDSSTPPVESSPTLISQLAAEQKPAQSKAEYFATLDKMSTRELIALAEDQEVDLGGKVARADVLKALKAAAE